MAAGATCYLRVNVDGALFSLGDGHYRQGEGESCGTAVEGAMHVTAIVDLIKGGGPGLAADRDRHPPDVRRIGPAAGGGVAGRSGRDDHLARRALRARPARRLPAAHPDLAGADRQRRRHQLQRRHQDRQAAAARCRRPTAASTTNCAARQGHWAPSPTDTKRRTTWNSDCRASASWSPAAPAASAGRWSRVCSPRARPSRTAPAPRTRSPPAQAELDGHRSHRDRHRGRRR